MSVNRFEALDSPSPAYATIDLNAVRHNLGQIKQLTPQAKIMAVIKANAYGHGLTRIAKALKHADALAVARIDEAIQLRQAGVNQRILVLQGFGKQAELDAVDTFRLDSVIHSVHQINLLENNEKADRLNLWLKIDTGMNRLGFKPEQFRDAYSRLRQCLKQNRSVNLMTHLAAADDLGNPFTGEQIRLFTQLTEGLPGERSMASSAGIIAWPETYGDWVRPGLMLYGISPFSGQTGCTIGLLPVMNLHSRLIAVKQVKQGEYIGYGNAWLCRQDTRVGIAAIGYGDGYPRYMKSGAPVLVNGQRAALIGRVSMDMITLDLSKQALAKPGDPVTLWGEGLAVEEIANWADTIPYTLVCGITERVTKLYLGDTT
jgi:alanine racemase